jgi:hypothetical protein
LKFQRWFCYLNGHLEELKSRKEKEEQTLQHFRPTATAKFGMVKKCFCRVPKRTVFIIRYNSIWKFCKFSATALNHSCIAKENGFLLILLGNA